MKTLAGIIKKSLKYGVMVIALAISASVLAQEADFISISGVVKDSKTKDRLFFANVSVHGTNIGTVANSDGEFTIKIPKDANASELEISHLGYENKLFPVMSNENDKNRREFLLNPSSVEIKSVVVRPADPRAILSQAMSKVSQNYSTEPNSLTGFYRETIKQRHDYVSIAEAVAEIYKSAYRYTIENDKVKILKARKSSHVKKSDTLMVKMQGGPNVSLYLDLVRYPDLILNSEDMPYYDYKLLDIVNLNDEPTYVISFSPRATLEYPLYSGKIYVSVETLAITMAEFSMDLSDVNKATEVFVRKKPAGLRFEPISTSYLVNYKKDGDKYYLNYMRSEIKFRADWRRRIFKTYYTVMSEMAITERNTQNVNKISYKESFRPYTVLTDKINEYFDEDYWGSYNIIQPDESIQAAIKRFNRRYKKD